MYDIVGDIHGHADTLERLLDRLGYREQRGVYRHPERKLIFVGDWSIAVHESYEFSRSLEHGSKRSKHSPYWAITS